MRTDELYGRRVLVWGAGAEGRAVVARLGGRADLRVVVDGRPAGEKVGDVEVEPASREAIAWADVVVRSAGVPRHRGELEDVTVTTLVALWLADHRDDRVVAVTGTKGKSTTATLLTALLNESGYRTELAGNIGRPVYEVDGREDLDVFVVEVSSYQATDVDVSPRYGVLTNLADDHRSWHGSLERYRDDKLNLFAHDVRALAANGLDDVSRSCLPMSWPVTWFGNEGYTVHDGVVHDEGHRLVDTAGTALAPAHLALDLCGALTAARFVLDAPVSDAVVAAVVRGFAPLPGRGETVAADADIEFVDDVLATNPLAVNAALDAFADRAVVIVLGGADRGLDLDGLADRMAAHGRPLRAVLVSETAARWRELLRRRGVEAVDVVGDSIADAVAVADRLAPAGAVVLFAPCAPTPAALGSYVDRSRSFREAASAAIARRAAGAAS